MRRAPGPAAAPAISEWNYGYALPSDYLTKSWLKSDANTIYEVPHQVLQGAIYCNYEPVILEYIALNDTTTDPGTWPASFLEVVAAYLALLVQPEIVVDEAGKGGGKLRLPRMREALQAVWERKLSDARMKDASQQYPADMAPGRFVRARRGTIGTQALIRH